MFFILEKMKTLTLAIWNELHIILSFISTDLWKDTENTRGIKNSFTVILLHIISFHYVLSLFFKIFLLLSEQEGTWLNKLKLQGVPFTRLGETINSSEGMC
jgi:hypothetical protein